MGRGGEGGRSRSRVGVFGAPISLSPALGPRPFPSPLRRTDNIAYVVMVVVGELRINRMG